MEQRMLRWMSNFFRWVWREPRRRLYFLAWVFTLGPVSYGALVNIAWNFYYLREADWPPAVVRLMELHFGVVSTELYGVLTIASLSIGPPLLYFGIPALPLRERRATRVETPETGTAGPDPQP